MAFRLHSTSVDLLRLFWGQRFSNIEFHSSMRWLTSCWMPSKKFENISRKSTRTAMNRKTQQSSICWLPNVPKPRPTNSYKSKWKIRCSDLFCFCDGFCKHTEPSGEQKMVQFFTKCPRSWFDFENFARLPKSGSAFFSCEPCCCSCLDYIFLLLCFRYDFRASACSSCSDVVVAPNSGCIYSTSPFSPMFLFLIFISYIWRHMYIRRGRQREPSRDSVDYNLMLKFANFPFPSWFFISRWARREEREINFPLVVVVGLKTG